VQDDNKSKKRVQAFSEKEKQLSWHTATSGLFTFFAIKNYFDQRCENKRLEELSEELIRKFCVLGLLVVVNHHSRFLVSNIDELFKMGEPLDLLVTSITYLIKKGPKFINELNVNLYFKQIYVQTVEELKHYLEKETLYGLLDDIMNLVCDIREEKSETNSIYFIFTILYSALCDADEWDAKYCDRQSGILQIEMDEKRSDISEDITDQYIAKQQETTWANKEWPEELVRLRQDLYKKLNTQASSDLIGKISTLTAPTGSGKTLALLNLAVKLRAQYQEKFNRTPRIIYCLPYLSIIDQVAAILKDIFDLPNLIQCEKLTVDHHLASIEWEALYEDDDIFDYFDLRGVQDFVKLWRSDVVVTTFVKFWYTIIAGTKRRLLPQNRIAGAIIILDEVQNIPSQYWDITYHALAELSQRYGCSIILSSATQPLIVPEKKSLELAKGISEISFSRYNIIYNPQFITINEFIQRIIVDLSQGGLAYKKNVMVVMNTRRNARYIYDTLNEWLRDPTNVILKSNVNLFYLSSNVIPIHRKEILNDLISRLENSQTINPILICTQVIEAGIDVSFDIVYRDFGPLDSLIQVAGRCNRHYKSELPGKVFIVCLEDEKGVKFSQIVYQDITKLGATHEALTQTNNQYDSNIYHFSEKEIAERGQLYFRLMNKRKNTKECVKAIQTLNFEHINDCYKLIVDNSDKITLFIPWDEKGTKILQRISSGLKKDKRNRMKIDPDFYHYIINISERDLQELKSTYQAQVTEIKRYKRRYNKYKGLKKGIKTSEGVWETVFYTLENPESVYDEAGLKLVY